jgi:hypothetical protein
MATRLLFFALLLGLFGAAVVPARAACDDPFAGVNLRFDPGYWPRTDFCQHSVAYSEIRSGGPPPDGIPPLDSPQFEPISAALAWLAPQSPVIALEVEGEAKAYPLAVLIWHEIANDVIGAVPVAVTFCPLCNSAIVFDRRLDGQELTFGVSGNLRNSDLIMWDRQTESWWQQFTGEAIVGALTGAKLDMLPSQIVSFGEFSSRHPDGLVLSRDTGSARDYGRNPYAGYDRSAQPFLFEDDTDPRLPALERVLAAFLAGDAVAYPFAALEAERVINDELGGRAVVALWQPGVASALDGGVIDSSRDVGMAALFSRELGEQTLTFALDGGGQIQDAETGSVWNVWGEATDGPLQGEQLRLLLAAPHFWFAWAAFQPETRIYGQ